MGFMPAETRREALLAACTDHVLAEGLIGLSLRPLAKAVGHRMLIYHFGSRDGLVAAIVDESTNRSVDYLGLLTAPRTVRAGALWCGRRTTSRRCTPATSSMCRPR